jgi:cysteinyl-tRNA synthetase
MSDKTKDELQYEIYRLENELQIMSKYSENQKHKITMLLSALNAIRDIYRQNKEYEVSDKIRVFLIELGFTVTDNKN